MKALKTLPGILLICMILLPAFAKADNADANKVAELNVQIVQEIRDVLEYPYLKYESKNLNGEVKVLATVDESGKIIFKDAIGLNVNLTENVIAKLNSLNLWTSPDYSGKVFEYNIKYKN